ncbi:iron uptake transporter permease EfeU [Microbacterium luticocti]|uniref:iron uptake transporter permease EfeU n=1 Tax=Microbacterium luticocti TaxID=451764 RepID=UPI0003F55F08|nr:iron uptake transporter permease EfeU [Microbacterium luticocti]
MLATFVIGLREGLEAALIVGIIAAFLRRNGRRLTAMWLGVGIALALSLAVGITLAAVEQALPQAAQEGMETIIGIVAVFFVTSMLVWMQHHSRGMKRELEQQAGEALKDGHAFALAGMAFLAVLKEGFETSVFLLATFSASTSALLAAIGAVLGIAVAVAVGIGIYLGGVRLNLSRFFRITGGFLILVAAGLVMTVLRTAHEAGWLNAGQQQVLDLSWLVRPGSIGSALITGVLGIPADPRLIEVIGWLAYLIPVALVVYWPAARRPSARGAAALQASLAAGCAVAAAALAITMAMLPTVHTGALPLVDQAGTQVGTAALHGDAVTVSLHGAAAQTVRLAPDAAQPDQHAGLAAQRWERSTDAADPDAPRTMTLDEVAARSGGRLPIGIDRARQPGPFQVSWSGAQTQTVWTADGALLDVSHTDRAVATLSGGGLSTPRTVTLTDGGWHVPDAAVQKAADTIADAQSAADERRLWGLYLPALLVIAAGVLLARAVRGSRRLRVAAATPPTPSPESRPEPTSRSSIHVP